MALSRVIRNGKLTTTLARSCATSFQLSDIEQAAGHGRMIPWHFTIPEGDNRTDLQKAQHSGVVPDYDKNKGAQRVVGRIDGPTRCHLPINFDEVREKVNALKDEDGVPQWPHSKELPQMKFKDVMVNFHFDYIGLKSPPFGDAEMSEIENKCTVTRDNIHHARWEWLNLDSDAIDMDSMVIDLHEMYIKGVSYRTINLWLDYVSGSGSLYKDSIRNLSWSRIDS